jgi:hypothetical protein
VDATAEQPDGSCERVERAAARPGRRGGDETEGSRR